MTIPEGWPVVFSLSLSGAASSCRNDNETNDVSAKVKSVFVSLGGSLIWSKTS